MMKDIIHLPDGWEIFAIGREYRNYFWLESRHIKSGKLCRDLGVPIVTGETLRDVAYKAAQAIDELS